MTVTYKEYEADKKKFFEKHGYDYRVDTSQMMDERYAKTYLFEDGATWYELMCAEYVTEVVELKKVKVQVSVKMFKTEYWSSEEGSRFYYEKF